MPGDDEEYPESHLPAFSGHCEPSQGFIASSTAHLVLEEAGEGAHVAEVEAGVAAGEAAEVAGLVRLGRGHVVVDPHPPARVQRGQVLCGNS